MRRSYVRGVRALRSGLSAVGLLAQLDRWAARSRLGMWVRSLLAVYDLREMVALDLPWWPFKAMTRVEEHLASRRQAQVFEWGSGASTVWLAKRVESVTAIEHDLDWARELMSLLPVNARLMTIPPAQAPDRKTGVLSRKAEFVGLDFADYADAIHRRAGMFDLIVVDGRAREACLSRAVDRLAPGGMILVDNVERARYREAIARLGSQIEVQWTRGLTPCLPYPTRAALITLADS